MTPSTAKVHGGTARPSRAAYGSTQPPMQASTWQRTPRAAAAAAISVTGSTTPWAYDGALATTSTVSSSIARRPSRRRRPGSRARPAPAPPRRRSSARPCGTPRARSTGSTIRGPVDVGPASRAPCTASRHRLGAAGGHRADRAVGGVEQPAREADQLVLHLQQAGERRRVEAVGAGVRRHRLAADPVDLGVAGVVDVGEGAAAVHRQVAAPAGPRSRASGSLMQGSFRGRHLGGVEGVAGAATTG